MARIQPVSANRVAVTAFDPPVPFELRLSGNGQAQLINEDEKADPNAPVSILTRSAS
jgi:hypothetical protein